MTSQCSLSIARQSLCDQAWTLAGRDSEGDPLSLSATVPSTVHSVLQDAGMIPGDLFKPGVENQLTWIGEQTWKWTTDFPAQEDWRTHEHVELVCDGLDTLAKVSINGSLVGQVENMFRRYRWDIRPWLRDGSNRIEIDFDALAPALREFSTDPALVDGVEVAAMIGDVQKLRKMACNFGWDWGPKFPTVGPWKPIHIELRNGPRFETVRVDQRHANGRVELILEPEILDSDPSCHIEAGLFLNGASVGQFEGRRLVIDNPKLWWPLGLGEPTLYELRVHLVGEEAVRDSWTRKIGLRRVQCRQLDDAIGRSFEFVVNGVQVFATGANWIPDDIFPHRISEATYRQKLEAAARSNMNMMRVWGGGIYEPDCFYDLCDELGIMVWQDFMFACGLYPTFRDGWLENVRAEAEQQVKRLRHHASLVFWCGNNEIEHNFVAQKWGPMKGMHSSNAMSFADYDRLFSGVLGATVRVHDPEKDYISASPHDPVDRNRWPADRHGDNHYWEAWFWGVPFIDQRSSHHRFVSEFGCQSLPSLAMMSQIGLDPDAPYSKDAIAFYQRCGEGTERLETYLEREFGALPATMGDAVWQSQIMQGLALKYAVEHWRTSGGRSRGALFWQFNDCWPAISWSVLDHLGHEKHSLPMVRRSYAPIMIAVIESRGGCCVQALAMNETARPVDVEFRSSVFDMKGNLLKSVRPESGTIQPGGVVKDFGTIELMQEARAAGGPGNVFAHLELRMNGGTISSDCVFLAAPRDIRPLPAEPEIRCEALTPGSSRLTVTSKLPVFWFTFESTTPGLHFDDNAFHLPNGQSRTVLVSYPPEISSDELRESITWRCLGQQAKTLN